MDAGLTREDVAELTFNALFAQRVGFDDDRGLHVKANDRNVIVTNGTKDEMNTLAQNTFGLYAVEGTVVANGMTDESLAATVKSEEMTTLRFDEATDLDKDGKYDYAMGDVEDFEVETGLDMIGHAAKIYYKLVKDAPVVYAIVDQATLVEVIDNNVNTTKLAKAANDAGFKKNSILDIKASEYVVNYDMGTTLADKLYIADGDGAKNDIKWIDNVVVKDVLGGNVNEGTETINAAKKLILISNSANKEVDTVIILDQYLDTVADINKDGEYSLTTEPNNMDMLVVDGEAQEKDYVIVTDIGNNGKVLVAETAEVVNANVTKLIASSTVTTPTPTTIGVVADGETYSKSKVLPTKGAALANTTAFDSVNKIGNYDLILDAEGKMIAMATEPAAPSYAYVAQFGYVYGRSGNSVTAQNNLTALVYFADGTSGVYEVDLGAGKTDLQYNDGSVTDDLTSADLQTATVATIVENMNGGTGKQADLFAGDKGIWNVKVQANGTVTIKDAASTANGDEDLVVATKGANTFANDTWLMNSHSTMLADNGTSKTNVVYDDNGTPADATDDKLLHSNSDTIFFYVNGKYDETASDNGLTVNVITGIKNAKTFQNDGGTTGGYTNFKSGVYEAWINKSNPARYTYEVMGIEDIAVGGANGVYYYDTDKFEIDYVDGKGYTITYILYGADGETYTMTYDRQGKYFATSDLAWAYGHSKDDGFYKIGATDIEAYVTASEVAGSSGAIVDGGTTGDGLNIYAENMKGEKVTYVVNAAVAYDEYEQNIYDDTTVVGSIADNAVFVDMTGNNLNSLDAIIDAIKDNDQVYISYRYDFETYKASIIYVSSYTPASTVAPGTQVNGNAMVNYPTTSYSVASGNVQFKLTKALADVVGTTPAETLKVKVTLESWSSTTGQWTVYGTVDHTITGDGTAAYNVALSTLFPSAPSGAGYSYRVLVDGVAIATVA